MPVVMRVLLASKTGGWHAEFGCLYLGQDLWCFQNKQMQGFEPE